MIVTSRPTFTGESMASLWNIYNNYISTSWPVDSVVCISFNALPSSSSRVLLEERICSPTGTPILGAR
ncbi:hypothetical protein AQUCO_02700406v1 [Aquilegia coerulea]|uniref:Uncharacterized protein n=1 Tax=Aquilegia coerulea TaxID=218851 RepID=A0A2G5D7L9_AQUCA|nr:hypothetical protein AQUCO_02700406v1 [Aquilegia coerulea]